MGEDHHLRVNVFGDVTYFICETHGLRGRCASKDFGRFMEAHNRSDVYSLHALGFDVHQINWVSEDW